MTVGDQMRKFWLNEDKKVYGEYTCETSFKQTKTFDNISEAIDAADALADHLITMNVTPPYHVTGIGSIWPHLLGT